VSEGVALLTNW